MPGPKSKRRLQQMAALRAAQAARHSRRKERWYFDEDGECGDPTGDPEHFSPDDDEEGLAAWPKRRRVMICDPQKLPKEYNNRFLPSGILRLSERDVSKDVREITSRMSSEMVENMGPRRMTAYGISYDDPEDHPREAFHSRTREASALSTRLPIPDGHGQLPSHPREDRAHTPLGGSQTRYPTDAMQVSEGEEGAVPTSAVPIDDEKLADLRRQIAKAELEREQLEISGESLKRHVSTAESDLATHKRQLEQATRGLQRLCALERNALVAERKRTCAVMDIAVALRERANAIQRLRGVEKKATEQAHELGCTVAASSVSNTAAEDQADDPMGEENGETEDVANKEELFLHAWQSLQKDADKLGRRAAIHGIRILDGAMDSLDNLNDGMSDDEASQGRISTRRQKNAQLRGKKASNAPLLGETAARQVMVFNSAVRGPPTNLPLLLTPVCDNPDRVAAVSFDPSCSSCQEFNIPAHFREWEETQIKRVRVEADVKQLRTSLKFMKEIAKDGTRMSNESEASLSRKLKALRAVEEEYEELMKRYQDAFGGGSTGEPKPTTVGFNGTNGVPLEKAMPTEAPPATAESNPPVAVAPAPPPAKKATETKKARKVRSSSRSRK